MAGSYPRCRCQFVKYPKHQQQKRAQTRIATAENVIDQGQQGQEPCRPSWLFGSSLIPAGRFVLARNTQAMRLCCDSATA